jgi:hypothetical protein
LELEARGLRLKKDKAGAEIGKVRFLAYLRKDALSVFPPWGGLKGGFLLKFFGMLGKDI